MTGSEIKKMLSDIIDSLIYDEHPQALDDDLSDILADGDNRDEAIDRLIKMIEFYREDL
jgi:hypothetical protein